MKNRRWKEEEEVVMKGKDKEDIRRGGGEGRYDSGGHRARGSGGGEGE